MNEIVIKICAWLWKRGCGGCPMSHVSCLMSVLLGSSFDPKTSNKSPVFGHILTFPEKRELHRVLTAVSRHWTSVNFSPIRAILYFANTTYLPRSHIFLLTSLFIFIFIFVFIIFIIVIICIRWYTLHGGVRWWLRHENSSHFKVGQVEEMQ